MNSDNYLECLEWQHRRKIPRRYNCDRLSMLRFRLRCYNGSLSESNLEPEKRARISANQLATLDEMRAVEKWRVEHGLDIERLTGEYKDPADPREFPC